MSSIKKNLVLENLYNPSAAFVSEIVTDTLLVIQLLCAPVIIYAIFRKSQEMKIYRFYLLNTIIWNTIVEISLFLTAPTILCPYPYVLINSIFEHDVDIDLWYILFEISVFCQLNLIFAMVLSIMYRLCHLLHNNFTNKMLEILDKWSGLIGGCLIGQSIGFILVFTMFEMRRHYVLSESYFELMAEDLPILKTEFQNCIRFDALAWPRW